MPMKEAGRGIYGEIGGLNPAGQGICPGRKPGGHIWHFMGFKPRRSRNMPRKTDRDIP
ncbi:MAG: hypothetical protein ACI4EX_08410 [Lachnospiraceae bacterium]